MDAIIYSSNSGFTAEYANMLGKKIGLPVHSLGDNAAPTGGEIIYLGWLMAGKINGYKKAEKRFKISAVCAVGMGKSGSQLDDVRKSNSLSENIPLFTLQGGFDISKLHGIYKFMMNTMKKTAGKALQNKTDRTADEDDMLDLLMNGGSRISEENLTPVLNWFNSAE